MVGGEGVKPALGIREGMDGAKSRIEEAGEETGGDRSTGILGSGEIEDGKGMERGVLGSPHGGEAPVEEGGPGVIVTGFVEAEELAEGLEGLMRVADGRHGIGDGFLD